MVHTFLRLSGLHRHVEVYGWGVGVGGTFKQEGSEGMRKLMEEDGKNEAKLCSFNAVKPHVLLGDALELP